MGSPTRPMPPGLSRLNGALFACRIQATVYARCCTATLPAVAHKQCQAEFAQLTKCIQQAITAAKKK